MKQNINEKTISENGTKTLEGKPVRSTCLFCGKPLPKWKGGRGKPRKFCKGTNCAMKNYQKTHPRQAIVTGDA